MARDRPSELTPGERTDAGRCVLDSSDASRQLVRLSRSESYGWHVGSFVAVPWLVRG